MYETLEIACEDHVATVTITGTSKGNAMGPAFWEELPRAFDALGKDEEVRAIVLRGSGDHFTYGLDLMAMAPQFGSMLQGEYLAAGRTQFLDLLHSWQSGPTAIAACSKPVIAAIDGWCIGGGLNVVAACDMRLASARAKMSLREVRLAIVPDLGALQRLPPLIGQGATRRMALTGEDFDAARGLEIGLIDEVHETPEALYEAAAALARQIATNPPLVVQGIKRVLNKSVEREIADGLEYVALWNSAFLASKDLMEAFAAFMEKRDPEFKGH